MNTESRRKLFVRAQWLFLVLVVGSTGFMWVYKFGAKEGRRELISQLNQPELRVTHFSRDDIQLVMIEQRMAQGDFRGQRVEIDLSAAKGLKAERLGSSGSGRYGYMDEVALWRIINDTDREFPLTETEFTNLPDGFRLPKNFEADFIIPLNPKS